MISPDTKLTAGTSADSGFLTSPANTFVVSPAITFNSDSREMLRITNDGYLIVGKGLSKEKATQETAELLVAAFKEQIQKMVDKRIASIKSELDRMNHNDTIATEDYLNYGPRNTTPRTDFIAHKGYTERTYICEMTELARILETELATMTARAEKAEADTARMDWIASRKSTELVYFAAAGWSVGWSGPLFHDKNVYGLRAAIDSAMKEASQ